MEVVKETRRKTNIKIDELYYGWRRHKVSFASAQAARDLGVTTSAISTC
jgi:hypothetical protein